MTKILACYVLKDKLEKPIKNIPYKVVDGKGRHIVKGITNSKGETLMFKKARGTQVNLFLKLNLLGFSHINKTIISGDKEPMKIIQRFSGLFINFVLDEHEGEKGEYQRKTHIVKSGETLTSIAKKYGTTVQAIDRINKIINPNRIHVGQIIKIPPKISSNSPASNLKSTQKPKKLTGTYTVKKGDTLASIAKRAGKTTQELAKANNISNPNRIQVGQKILIPEASLPKSTSVKPKPERKKPASTPIKPEIRQTRSKNTGSPKIEVKPKYDCECNKYNLIWGSKVSCEFRNKVIQISKRNNINANDLMAIMAHETGGTFNPQTGSFNKHKNESREGYVGLIQFGKDASKRLGVTRTQLMNMSKIEQLDYVEKYLNFKEIKGKLNTLTDFYLSILFPVDCGKGNQPNHIVFDNSLPLTYKSNGKVKKNLNYWRKVSYAANPAFFKEKGELDRRNGKKYLGFKDGKTYVWEIAENIQVWHDRGKKYISTSCKEDINFSIQFMDNKSKKPIHGYSYIITSEMLESKKHHSTREQGQKVHKTSVDDVIGVYIYKNGKEEKIGGFEVKRGMEPQVFYVDKPSTPKIPVLFNGVKSDRRDIVSQKTRRVLAELAAESGMTKIYITSTLRTPEEQANAMWGKRSLYGPVGRAVHDVGSKYAKYGKSRRIKEMAKEIRRFLAKGRRTSNHCVTFELYAKMNVVDIGNNSNGLVYKKNGKKIKTKRGVKFDEACRRFKKVGKIHKYIPGDAAGEGAFHIEIKQ